MAMDYVEFSGKSVDEAITEACTTLGIESSKLDYEVIEKGSNGFLGIGSKPAIIKARKKEVVKDAVEEFLSKMFNAMDLSVDIQIDYDEQNRNMNIELKGNEMGILIGKRGQTLDSVQYLASLVANRESDEYVRVKVDTENYRKRRKETLENLAKNIAFKVKKTRKPVYLEPMNPYERRVIHSVLQNDRYVEKHSEGEEPYRKVVVTLKRSNNQ